MTTWKTTPPQGKFWKLWWYSANWALAFVAGFGSGKSELLHYLAVFVIYKFKWANVAVYAPTYDLLKLNNIPRIQEVLDKFGLKYKFNKQDFIFYVEGHGKIVCRSMDNPSRIIAYEVFASFVDELDTMPEKQATEAWEKLIARNRQQPEVGTLIKKGALIDNGESVEVLQQDAFYNTSFSLVNKCGVFTTPEGFKFTYKKWKKVKLEGYELVRAATESNPYLPKSYIKALRESYPPQLIDAYLNGEFVNLTGGAVYHCFNRTENTFLIEELFAEELNIESPHDRRDENIVRIA